MAAFALLALVQGCTPFEHHDDAALRAVRKKFGAPYTLHAQPAPPAIHENYLSFVASYDDCANQSSTFSVSLDDDAPHLGGVLIATRHAPVCDSTAVSSRTRGVRLALPTEAVHSARYLAFPPGSEFELWSLGTPLAPPCPPAAMRLYIHRASPKQANPNGPCSTMLEMPPSATLEEVRALASSRLGVEVALSDEAGAPAVLFDGAALVAREAADQPQVEGSAACLGGCADDSVRRSRSR